MAAKGFPGFIFFLFSGIISTSEVIKIDLWDVKDFQELPRFWTSTGFCPPAPINDSSSFLLSPSVKQNLELIASVPNSGISHIRTHWILQLIDAQFSASPKFSFRKMDKFFHFLRRNHLTPHIEFMGNPGSKFSGNSSSLWRELSKQMINHSLQRFGSEYVNNFRFETWNEPDLVNYNTLNFTRDEFISYVIAIREGMAKVQETSEFRFKLRGPAGLFHRREAHQLCYGILEYCSRNPCPIDILTFHRKGLGEAKEILKGELELLRNLTKEFPWIDEMPLSNNEADPTSGWSHPLAMNSDVRYAAKLVRTVLLHWDAKRRGLIKNLESLSHDNAFLSYHPYEFDQRTLLAHFRMNNSRPVYSEFIKKPVLGALTLLSNLASESGSVQSTENLTLISTKSSHSQEKDYGFYSCVLIVSTRRMSRKTYRLEVKLPPGKDLIAFAEILDNDRTNPAKIWRKNSSPSFPTQQLFLRMRKAQSPAILIPPQPVQSDFVANLVISAPFIISLRFCENSTRNDPQRVKNLRLNPISSQRVTILWNEDFRASRCIRNYQIFFKPKPKNVWKEISRGWHISDLSFDFWRPKGILGSYKVRSVDVLGRFGRFSKVVLKKPRPL